MASGTAEIPAAGEVGDVKVVRFIIINIDVTGIGHCWG